MHWEISGNSVEIISYKQDIKCSSILKIQLLLRNSTVGIYSNSCRRTRLSISCHKVTGKHVILQIAFWGLSASWGVTLNISDAQKCWSLYSALHTSFLLSLFTSLVHFLLQLSENVYLPTTTKVLYKTNVASSREQTDCLPESKGSTIELLSMWVTYIKPNKNSALEESGGELRHAFARQWDPLQHI